MITTEHLIERLAGDVRPRSPAGAARRLAVGIALGGVVSLLFTLIWLGRPAGFVQDTGIPTFTMKLSFAVGLATAAAVLLYVSGRPGHRLGNRIWWLAVPPALVGVTALMELNATAPQYREQVLLGSTWATCLVSISLLSLPVLAGVAWAFRRFAPTRLRLAGFLAGVTSGATAAALYAFYCPETTATFLVSWYSLGIAAAGLVGLVAGRRLLSW